MNWQIIIRANIFTKLFLVLLGFSFCTVSLADWKVDLSRRVKDLKPVTKKIDYGTKKTRSNRKTVFNYFKGEAGPTQEVVILNTKEGFLPSTVNLKAGYKYKIHIVNINEETKNTSFIMEDFSEHHGTFFGEHKTFVIHPQKEGVFRYVSPETAAQGQMVVQSKTSLKRRPASK